jgi:hypothetical protein
LTVEQKHKDHISKGQRVSKYLRRQMNINRPTIPKIENGKFRITVDYLVRFSIFLDYEFKVIDKNI